MTSLDQARRSVFAPQAVAAINRAYSGALEVLLREGAGELRVKLAEHMMSFARSGELDEERLCRCSVHAVLGRWPQQAAGEVHRNAAGAAAPAGANRENTR